MDLISIIVPVYNSEKYLKECIESILNQTYQKLEIVLVNDGSTDNSLNICESYKCKDSRIKIISQPNNGVSSARNQGIINSSGSYICFVDSDDLLSTNCIDVLYREMSTGDVDLVICNYEYDYEGRRIKKKARLAAKTYCFSDIEEICIDDGTMSGILFGSVCGAIYKRSIIEEHGIRFNNDLKINEDGIFNLLYCSYSKKIKVLSNEYLYIYRQWKNTSTNIQLEKNLEEANNALRDIYITKFRNYDKQMKARMISIAFWNILNTCSPMNNNTFHSKIKTIKTILSKEELRNSYNSIDLRKLNRYKFVYYYLMKNRRYRSLYILTRFIYPVMRKFISR